MTPPVTEIVLVPGPIEPATKRGRVGGRRRVGDLARQARGGVVDLVDLVLQAVLGEHDARAAEGVGLDHVGAGVEVAAGGCAGSTSGRVSTRCSLQPSKLGPPKSSAVEVQRLDRGAHRPVEDEDALVQSGAQRRDAVSG